MQDREAGADFPFDVIQMKSFYAPPMIFYYFITSRKTEKGLSGNSADKELSVHLRKIKLHHKPEAQLEEMAAAKRTEIENLVK